MLSEARRLRALAEEIEAAAERLLEHEQAAEAEKPGATVTEFRRSTDDDPEPGDFRPRPSGGSGE